jgi:hypothetical protein
MKMSGAQAFRPGLRPSSRLLFYRLVYSKLSAFPGFLTAGLIFLEILPDRP